VQGLGRAQLRAREPVLHHRNLDLASAAVARKRRRQSPGRAPRAISAPVLVRAGGVTPRDSFRAQGAIEAPERLAPLSRGVVGT
jgi:hypothetical protein